GSINDTDDVARELRAHDLVIGVEIEAEFDAFERKRRERLLLRRLFFQLGVFDVGVAEEEFEEIILPRHRRRYRMIQSQRGGEIPLLDAATAGAPGSAHLPSPPSPPSNAQPPP